MCTRTRAPGPLPAPPSRIRPDYVPPVFSVCHGRGTFVFFFSSRRLRWILMPRNWPRLLILMTIDVPVCATGGWKRNSHMTFTQNTVIMLFARLWNSIKRYVPFARFPRADAIVLRKHVFPRDRPCPPAHTNDGFYRRRRFLLREVFVEGNSIKNITGVCHQNH